MSILRRDGGRDAGSLLCQGPSSRHQEGPATTEATPSTVAPTVLLVHGNTTSGLSTPVSSKVNQWTLLVGTLPLVFAVASGTATGLPVGPAQPGAAPRTGGHRPRG